MTAFQSPAVVELLDKHRFRLVQPFEYPIGPAHAPEFVIRVPAGFVTDLASVPRALWGILPPHGRYAKAAILHDYLLSQCLTECKDTYRKQRRFADEVFYGAMLDLNVPEYKAATMYLAVKGLSQWRVLRKLNAKH